MMRHDFEPLAGLAARAQAGGGRGNWPAGPERLGAAEPFDSVWDSLLLQEEEFSLVEAPSLVRLSRTVAKGCNHLL